MEGLLVPCDFALRVSRHRHLRVSKPFSEPENDFTVGEALMEAG